MLLLLQDMLGVECTVRLVIMLWSSDSVGSDLLRVTMLHVLTGCFKQNSNACAVVFDAKNPSKEKTNIIEYLRFPSFKLRHASLLLAVLAVLLTCLLHSESIVRSAALQTIKVVRRSAKEHAYAGLLKKIVKQEEEVCADPAHVQQVRQFPH